MHSCIYTGVVRHRRGGDVAHEFRYPLAWHFVDLSETTLLQQRGLLGAPGARWSMAALRPGDHQTHPACVAGDGGGESGKAGNGASPLTTLKTLEALESRLRDRVEHVSGRRPRGAVRMLTQLSYLGLYFSPITLYYFYDPPEQGRERLAAVVAEVNNTPWGEQHNYVLVEAETKSRSQPLSSVAPRGVPLGDDGRDNAGNVAVGDPQTSPSMTDTASPRFRTFQHDKDFHVSPFMTADRRYRWRWTDPGDTLTLHIESVPATRQGIEDLEPLDDSHSSPGAGKSTFSFDATMTLRRSAWTRGAHLRLLATRPLAPLRIVGGIYWQALRLWCKGARFVPHPQRTPRDASNSETLADMPDFDQDSALPMAQHRRG